MAVTLTAAELSEATGVDSATATRLLAVASALVQRFADGAPAEISNEAAIRTAGWLAEQPSAAIRSKPRAISRQVTCRRCNPHFGIAARWLVESVENSTGRCGMTRRLALRRFPNQVIRRRQGPGARNEYGEYEPGQIVETIFPGEGLAAFFGGFRFRRRRVSHRTVKGVRPARDRSRRGETDALAWGGSVLTWNGEPLVWGGGDGMLFAEDSIPFLAAFEDRQGDVLVYAGIPYTVEESQSWPRYSRAVALRET